MKKLIYLFLLIGLSSCELYLIDPVYDHRDPLVGRYEMEEYSETYNSYARYTIWIEESSHYSDQVYIQNFYGANVRVCASLIYDKITIHRQIVNGYEIEGVGTVYGNEISFSYSVKDLYSSARTDFCMATAW